jgi:IMP cyclohydrolase
MKTKRNIFGVLLVAGMVILCSCQKDTGSDSASRIQPDPVPSASEASVSYSGGTGKSMEDAVVITAPSSLSGISAENEYIQMECGRRNEDWTKMKQVLVNGSNGNHYDVITIQLKNGTTREFCFDISSFFGK